MGGLSLGGAVAFRIGVKSPKLTDGAILLSPAIRSNKLHFPILKKFTFLIGHFFPNVKFLKSSGRNGCKYHLNEHIKNDPYLYNGRLWAGTVT